ncbi:MAG: SMC-Scp complex subunit ScpB [Chloroflexota bacterium]|nr:SMC-Scp complex subunit ScpB [Chloroflexota bacterium]
MSDGTANAGPAAQLALDGTSETMSPVELAALIEALLLVAPEPPTIAELAEAAAVTPARIEEAVAEMDRERERGWIVQRHGDSLHLATAPRFAPHISAFLGLEREGKLSAAALETLAIIAYQQPVTRSEIEAVRGVDSSGVLATLHARELIEPVSRLAAIGNPFQYGTTVSFLQLFGLSSLADLPPLGSFEGTDGSGLLERAMSGAESVDHSRGVSAQDMKEQVEG